MWGVGEASPSAKPVVFAYPLCVDTPPKGGHAHISAEALSGQRPQRPLNNPSLKGVVTPASEPGRLQKRPSVATSLCSSLPSGFFA